MAIAGQMPRVGHPMQAVRPPPRFRQPVQASKSPIAGLVDIVMPAGKNEEVEIVMPVTKREMMANGLAAMAAAALPLAANADDAPAPKPAGTPATTREKLCATNPTSKLCLRDSFKLSGKR